MSGGLEFDSFKFFFYEEDFFFSLVQHVVISSSKNAKVKSQHKGEQSDGLV